jgi:hypothetical protein
MNKDEKALRLVGYWRGEFEDADWPDPAALVDANWRPEERPAIIRYLRTGVRIHEDLGFSHCRFPGGPPDEEMGNAEFTDGVWIWPEGLAVYVEQFDVRLPTEFVQHMAECSFAIPQGLDAARLESTSVDLEFWRQWTKSAVKT